MTRWALIVVVMLVTAVACTNDRGEPTPTTRTADGDAASRIDTIFADRLDGYRDRQLARVDRGGRP